MVTLKFKTTMKCMGCIATVTPFLNNKLGKDKWKVDIQNPDKVLTVERDNKEDVQEIIKAVEDAGFKAEKLD